MLDNLKTRIQDLNNVQPAPQAECWLVTPTAAF